MSLFASKSGSRMQPLLDKVAVIDDEAAHDKLVKQLAQPAAPTILSFVNAHGFNLGWQNADIRRRFTEANVLLRDGIGMKVLFKLLGREPGLNMNGTDFIPELLVKTAGQRVALFGTSDDVLGRAGKVLAADGVAIAGTLNGFLPVDAYIDRFNKLQPDIVVLAMGMPRQEQVAEVLAKAAVKPCLIINGGAILDFVGGKVTRAPGLFRKSGMEWLWRLMQEPRRLFKRYVVGNIVFLARAVQMLLEGAHHSASTTGAR